MKMKSFAMVAMTGLLTAALSHVSPVFADDANSSMQPSSGTGRSLNPNYDVDTSNVGSMNENTNANNNVNSSSASANNSSTTSDGGSPDTATGDDDY